MLQFRVFSVLLICAACCLSAVMAATSLQTRKDFSPGGPTGILDTITRIQDSIGTATQVWANGPMEKHQTISAPHSSPISSVYRLALASTIPENWKSFSDRKYEIGVNGFSTVGEVHYIFNNSRENFQGRSTQVMLACRCIEEKECNTAVLVRPINIVKRGSDGKMEDTDKQVCLYEAVDGKFSDCHSELVRVSNRSKADEPQYAHEHNYFTYKVPDPVSEDYWEANGQRGWTHNCTEEELNDLPFFDISSLKRENLTFNEHKTSSSGPFCRPPRGVQYYRDSAGSVDTCALLYKNAAPSGAHRGTQQDEIAIAKGPDTFMAERLELTSFTELALSVSAACLGILFAWSMYVRIMRKKDDYKQIKYFLVGLVKQVLSYSLEALPLHIALAHEIRCLHWKSHFAFLDAIVTLAKPFSSAGSAKDSMLVLIPVMGEVRFLTTNVILIAFFTGVFDLIAIVIFIMTIVRKTKWLLGRQREFLTKGGHKDTLIDSFGLAASRLRRLGRNRGSGQLSIGTKFQQRENKKFFNTLIRSRLGQERENVPQEMVTSPFSVSSVSSPRLPGEVRGVGVDELEHAGDDATVADLGQGTSTAQGMGSEFGQRNSGQERGGQTSPEV